ncbi:hypothetical protein BDW59DRAFT_146140 [Aspergillus cavernicola]|uniref:Uncharacterized protein n=1 Tax=Aspergillus cavernicola TaxID=176166 RepID=A0ABR4ID43_9EURO
MTCNVGLLNHVLFATDSLATPDMSYVVVHSSSRGIWLTISLDTRDKPGNLFPERFGIRTARTSCSIIHSTRSVSKIRKPWSREQVLKTYGTLR